MEKHQVGNQLNGLPRALGFFETAIGGGRQERVVVYIGAPTTAKSELLITLQDGGWSIRQVAPDISVDGLRKIEAVIGIIDFVRCPFSASLRHLLSELAPRMRWVALIDAEETDVSLLTCVGEYCYDFHRMPANPERLLHTLGHAWGMNILTRIHGSDVDIAFEPERDMVGMSPVMFQLFSDIRKISHTNCSVLIRGETGSGKELCALAVHAHSGRANGPFVAVNCGALPPELIQSELFGYEKGAFTGAYQRKQGLIETAAGGTLFLARIFHKRRRVSFNQLIQLELHQ